MATQLNNKLIQLDNAVEKYYKQLNITNYRDHSGIGLFLNYIKTEQLDDPAIPIENELGDKCDPDNCAYTWMNQQSFFPIPSYAQIPYNKQETFMFYILQYCYKHNQPPSNKYIQTTIIPKCTGTTNTTLPQPPIAFGTDLSLSNMNTITNKYSMCNITEGFEGKADEKADTTATIIRLSVEDFIPKCPARAHLNIFTSKELTAELSDIIQERFENNMLLYYYTDISSALQMNDKQMKLFKLLINDIPLNISIVNYDLHLKNNSNKLLYGIVVPNDNNKIQKDKWLWQLKEFLTVDNIYKKYKIKSNELPISSRQRITFQKQLTQQLTIEENLIDSTNWNSIQQIKSLKRNIKVAKISVLLSIEMWKNECKNSFSNMNLPLIPIVVNKQNNHWIEWIKIINIKSQNICVGVSCKLDTNNNKWSVQAICLDRGDIYNKHRLVGLQFNEYNKQLDAFKTSIAEIKFTDNNGKETDKKLNVLKQQVRSQQDSIVRLKETLLRARNAHKYNRNDNDEIENKQYITEYIDDDKEDNINGDAWLDQIVDDVIKLYDVFVFKTNPIGAKRNIYIEKQFTTLWMNKVTPRFNNEAMMYYWLDYTTAMQMCHGYSKQYIYKNNKQFMVAIINYELKDVNGNVLYGIIICGNKTVQSNNKYAYKLKTFMRKEEIKIEYGINEFDLPQKSRKHGEFMNKLLLRRRINCEYDLNNVNWSNLKLFKSQSTNNDMINKSITITQKVMKEYCNVALEKLNTSNRSGNNNNNNNLIPIVVIDKHKCFYDIEWVLIVNIIHRNCDVGISFKYNEKSDVFIATAIYLDKGEIESKHKLIGLKMNYCKHLRPFSSRKFKFKSEKHVDNNVKYELMQYKDTDIDKKINVLKQHELFKDETNKSKHGKGSNDAIYKEAYSSIKIPRNVCDKISNQIKEKIQDVYPHIVKSTMLNKNNEFTVENGNIIRIINCGVHDKVTNETLYVILESYKQFNYKWVMMDKLFSTNDIKNQFNINSDKLPNCYQSNPDIEIQLSKQKDIINFIETPQFYKFVTNSTPWIKRDKIPIYNTKNNKNRITLSLSKQQFLKQLNNAVSNTSFNGNNVIPILMKNNNDNDHHVEYVQIVNIQPGCDIGIAYIFDENKQIKVAGIHIDVEFIRSQYELLFPGNKCDVLDHFTCVYDHLTIGNPDLYKNGMERYEKIYKNKCQKVSDFMRDSIKYFTKMMSNVANVTMENIQMWINKARIALKNKKNGNYSLNVSQLYDDKHVSNFQILMDSPLYIKDLQEINNWYFMQTLNSKRQLIVPHVKHIPIPIVIK